MANYFTRMLSKLTSSGKRYYDAAKRTKFTMDWKTNEGSADKAIQYASKEVRARSRDLARNNDYVRDYIRQSKDNVVGEGFSFECKPKEKDGKYDLELGRIVENNWNEFIKSSEFNINGRATGNATFGQILNSCQIDGDILVHCLVSNNGFGISVKLYESDHLDGMYNDINREYNGNLIKMGVEVDVNNRHVAYWIDSKHPYDFEYISIGTNQYKIRIPANTENSRAFIVFKADRPDQNRGISWLASSVTKLRQIDKYEEAEVIAARIASSKVGFIIPKGGDEYTGQVNDDGNIAMNLEPGQISVLPEGFDFKEWNPQHPTANYEAFRRGILRGIASGLGVSYNMLARDLERSSFSSIRAGMMSERDTWKGIQKWFIDSCVRPIYEFWLLIGLRDNLFGIKNNDVKKTLDKYRKIKFGSTFRGRSWEWVDPMKDVSATILKIESGLSTYEIELGKMGLDFEDLVDKRQQEQEYMKAHGVETQKMTELLIKYGNQASAAADEPQKDLTK